MDGGKCPVDKLVSKWTERNVQWTNKQANGWREMSNGQTSKQMDGGKCLMDKQVSKWMKGNVQWTSK